MLPHYTTSTVIVVFSVVLLCMLFGMVLFSWAVRPLSRHRKGSDSRASETYECGYPAVGDPRAIGFQYLNYAALFLVFDIAAIYLFLYARLNPLPGAATSGMLVGIVTLCLMILFTTGRRDHAA